MWLPPVTFAQPATEPVSLAEAQEYLRIDVTETEFDNEITSFIAASRSEIEALTSTRMITQTVNISGAHFASLAAMPIGPIQSVASVKYVDLTGTEQTIDSDDYELVVAGLTARIVPSFNANWPVAAIRVDAVRVQLVVGYGDAGSDLPRDIRFALLRAIRAKFDHEDIDLSAHLVNHRLWMT